MRKLLQTSAMIAPLLIGSAFAQEAQEAVETPEAIVREQGPNELRIDWITGTTIRSPEYEKIGSVQDLILDQEIGELSAAIISVGGFLGFGSKQIAVDWNELQIDYDAREITLDLTREEAEAAPEYAFRERARLPMPTVPEPALDQPAGGIPPAPAPAN